MKPLKLNLNQLITFYSVAVEGSFSLAAEKLCLTQPAVTHQIRTLESCTGVKLVNIRRQRAYLTKAGEGLFSYASEIYEQAENAESFLDKLSEGSLTIGVATTLSPIIALAAGKFEQLFPNVKLSIKNGPSFEIVRELSDLQHNVVFVISLNYKDRKLETIRVSDGERLVLVVSPSFPVNVEKPLKLADLCHYPFLLPREGSATREVLLRAFKAEGLELEHYISVELDYLECSRRLAAMGNGIALMPEASVGREVASGELKMLHLADDMKVGVDALFRRDAPPHLPGRNFIQLAKEVFQSVASSP